MEIQKKVDSKLGTYLKVGPCWRGNNGALHIPQLEFEDQLQKYHLIFKDQVPILIKYIDPLHS